MSFAVNQKVYITVADTAAIGGGRHRAIIENIVEDMFDGSELYLVRTKGNTLVSVRKEAITEMKKKK